MKRSRLLIRVMIAGALGTLILGIALLYSWARRMAVAGQDSWLVSKLAMFVEETGRLPEDAHEFVVHIVPSNEAAEVEANINATYEFSGASISDVAAWRKDFLILRVADTKRQQKVNFMLGGDLRGFVRKKKGRHAEENSAEQTE